MAGFPRMPDAGMQNLDPEQLQRMLALASMGGMPGMPGMAGMPPPMPGIGGYPGAAPQPALDPNMAQVYGQMLQYLQQSMTQQQGFGGAPAGMGMPPPFAGQPPAYAPPQQQSTPTVAVSVEGMKFQYQLTEDDLNKVFARYGRVEKVVVDENSASAFVTFGSFQDGQSAINDLDGKVLNGLDGMLRIKWVSPPTQASPYAHGMSLPSLPKPSGAPWPGGAAQYSGLPSNAGGGPSGSAPDGGRGSRGARKYTCRFLIGIENDKEFQVARRLIGSKGSNMKKIVQQTDAKLRLRGVGSGYFEGSGQKESSEPLQLCISCTNTEGYKTAVRLTEELLSKVHDEFRQFCRENNRAEPDLQINLSENPILSSPRAWSGAGSGGAQATAPPHMGMGMGMGMPMGMDPGMGMDPSQMRERRAGRAAAKKKVPVDGDRGKPGPNAPSPEEIQRLINDRNEARRSCNFAEADRVRELLHSQGVALMDEPGARGKGQEVTTWRYWHD